MSSLVTGKTEFTDAECLVQALIEAGLPAELHEKLVTVQGYDGASARGHVIVRKGSCNETQWEGFAFERGADGKFTAHVSSHFTRMNVVKRNYTTAKAIKAAKAKGYALASQKAENGRVKLVLRRYA